MILINGLYSYPILIFFSVRFHQYRHFYRLCLFTFHGPFMMRKPSPADCTGELGSLAQWRVPFQHVRPVRPFTTRRGTALVHIATVCQHSSISQVYGEKTLSITQYSSKIFALDPYAYRSMFFQHRECRGSCAAIKYPILT